MPPLSPDILADDGLALTANSGWRITISAAIRSRADGSADGGERRPPARLIVSGMASKGCWAPARGRSIKHILKGLGTHEQGSPDGWPRLPQDHRGDPDALLPLRDSFVDTSEAELRGIAVPPWSCRAREDDDNGSGSARGFAPRGQFVEVPATI